MPKHSVFLNVYDFTPLNDYLKYIYLPGYHTGLQINGSEYCFCVVDSNPMVSGVIQIQPQSAEYRFNRKLFLGETNVSQEQLSKILERMERKYICGRYHMFKNNCNHFCNQLAEELLGIGKGAPSWVFSTTNCLRYFCCCLPTGMVTGLWAIQAIQQQEMKEEQALLAIGMRQI